MSPERRLDPAAGVTSTELIEHRRAGVDAVHVETALGHRHGQPPGPDAELEHAATGCGQLGDELERSTRRR